MKTLNERLNTIVTLLPEKQQAQFTAPLTAEESTDTRLVDAVRALAKSEGLVCMTPGEFSRAAAQHVAQRTMPAIAPADANSPKVLADRFAAITNPRAQTDFWRSLTALQRADLLKAQQQ